MMPKIGRQQIELDQFYTSVEAVKTCVKLVDQNSYDCIIEPSAGDGAFLSEITNSNLLAMDIEPKAPNIRKMDYFEFEIPPKFQNVLVIGNPPFGIKHGLSDAFLEKSFFMPNVRTVGFILPNTYNKPTRQRIIPPNWRIKSITPLKRDSFVYNGNVCHIPCSFFVFDKSPGKDLRFNESECQEAVDFWFGTKGNFELFIFGANPGRVIRNPSANNRGYYLKSKIKLQKLVDRLMSVSWNGNSCASGGVAWFSKSEVVKQYNETYK